MARVGAKQPFLHGPGVLFLAFLALAVRLVVPAGFMVEEAAGPLAPTIVICTGSGAMVVHVDANGVPKPADEPGEKPSNAGACIFAALNTPIQPPPAADGITKVSYVPIVSDGAIHHQSPGLGLAAPPPLQTGPPSAA